MLYVGGEVTQWRDSRRIVVDGPPVMKLREAEYLWQTSSYIIWPAAVRTPPLIHTSRDAAALDPAAASLTISSRLSPAPSRRVTQRVRAHYPRSSRPRQRLTLALALALTVALTAADPNSASRRVARTPDSPRPAPPSLQARELLKHLPIDSPTDCYISKLVLEGFVTAVVACPAIAEQRDPYAKGDIKHTNVYVWDKK